MIASAGRFPPLGLGTWRMGEAAARRDDEIAALRLGLDLGIRLLDTAEMYADGEAERIVGEAIRGRRDGVVVVDKVLPGNASLDGTIAAAERSLRRLATDRIDLYLLHWPGRHPLEATFEAFERLRDAGKILDYGLSNFDIGDLRAAEALPAGRGVAANQVLYNLVRRGIERTVLPWCAAREVTVMAYSPLEQGRLPAGGALARVAERRNATPARVALAWLLGRPGVVAIPKAARPEHVRDLHAALALELDEADRRELDHEFPPPARDAPLEVL